MTTTTTKITPTTRRLLDIIAASPGINLEDAADAVGRRYRGRIYGMISENLIRVEDDRRGTHLYPVPPKEHQ